MRNLAIVWIVSSVICWPVSAQEAKFKDVPADHWAAPAVREVVKRGLTKGFADGTFRGNKPVTRYELATMLEKALKLVGTEEATDEENSLQIDIKALRAEFNAFRKTPPPFLFNGEIATRFRVNSLATKSSARLLRSDYRFVGTLRKTMGDAELAITLDTVDAGFNNRGTYDPIRDIVSTELSVKSLLNLHVTLGPGPLLHTEPSNLFTEENVYYIRPRARVSVSTDIRGVPVTARYIVRGRNATTGVTEVHHLQGEVELWQGIHAAADWIRKEKSNDFRGSLFREKYLRPKLKIREVLGFSGLGGFKNILIGGEFTFEELFRNGLVLSLSIHRVGASYLTFPETFDMAGFDYFSRPLVNGTYQLGAKVSQKISEVVTVTGRGDVRLASDFRFSNRPEASYTAEGGLIYALGPKTSLEARYLVYNSQARGATSDLVTVGLNYGF